MVARSYFYSYRPYDSIMQFAEGKLQLSSEEQRVFLKTVHDFFTKEAFQGYLNGGCNPKLPSKLEKTFFSEALPVFLKSMDCSNEKKQRLLACIKSVTKPFFPKFKIGDEGQIDEATSSLRDAISEINRGGISETAKIYTKPLKKIKDTEKTAFETLLDSACYHEEDQNTLLEMLKQEHACGQNRLITELTKHLGNQQLAPFFAKIPTEFFILNEKELSNDQRRELRTHALQLVKPDLSGLTREELEQFVRFCISHGKTVSECITHILEKTKHWEAVLNSLEETADQTQKQAINAFWQKNFFLALDKLCPVNLIYNHSLFAWLAKHVPISDEHWTSLDGEFKKLCICSGTYREESLSKLHRRLRDHDVLELASKRPDLKNIRLKIILVIEKQNRKLEGERKKEHFIALFPNLIPMKSNLGEFFSQWLCAAFQGFGYDKVEDWKRSDELGWSDEIALAVHQAFSNLDNNLIVREWLPDVVKKRIQNKFARYCEIPFRRIVVAVTFELTKIIPEGDNRDKELRFVRVLLRSLYGGTKKERLSKKNLRVTIFSHLAKGLDLQGLEWVVKAFKEAEVGKHLPDSSDSPRLNAILEETLAGEKIGSKLLEEHSSFFQPVDHGYLKAILGALFHAQGKAVDLKRISPPYSNIPKDSFARIALFCRDEKGIAWMKEQVKGIDLCHLIYQSLEITIKNWYGTNCLTHMIDDYLNKPQVKQFREAIENETTDIVRRFFKIWLPKLVRSDSTVFCTRNILAHWMIEFAEEDWKSFEKICYDENLPQLLTQENFKTAFETMKGYLPVGYLENLMDRGLSSMKRFGCQSYAEQQKTLAIWRHYESERQFVKDLLILIFLTDDCKTISQNTLYQLIQKIGVTSAQLESLIKDFKREQIEQSFAHYGKIEIYQQMLTSLNYILEGFQIKIND